MQKQPQYVVDLIESEMQGKPGVELLCHPQSHPPPPPTSGMLCHLLVPSIMAHSASCTGNGECAFCGLCDPIHV